MRIFICVLTILLSSFFGQKISVQRIEPVELEIVFHDPRRPYIRVQIEGREYLQLLDLGAELEFSLRDMVLEKIQKEVFSQNRIANYKGVSRGVIEYVLPELRLNMLTLENVVVNNETEESINSTIISNNGSEMNTDMVRAGIIGNKILERGNLLLDFPNKKAYFIRNLESYSVNDYRVDTWMKVSFEWQRIGMILKVETDLGTLKLLIDTGATDSFIYSSYFEGRDEEAKSFTSSKFIIGERDFGKQRLIELKNGITFADEQGIIGMDFLRNHTFYIDYPNKVLYIKPSAQSSLPQ